jgi:hypothetical protein
VSIKVRESIRAYCQDISRNQTLAAAGICVIWYDKWHLHCQLAW